METQQPTGQEEVSDTILLNRQMYYLGTVISYLEQQLELAKSTLADIEEQYHQSQTPDGSND